MNKNKIIEDSPEYLLELELLLDEADKARNYYRGMKALGLRNERLLELKEESEKKEREFHQFVFDNSLKGDTES